MGISTFTSKEFGPFLATGPSGWQCENERRTEALQLFVLGTWLVPASGVFQLSSPSEPFPKKKMLENSVQVGCESGYSMTSYYFSMIIPLLQ